MNARRRAPQTDASPQRLEEMDDRADHVVSRQQLVIVVIGVGNHEKRLGRRRRRVEASTVFDGHDAIAPACNDQQRHLDPANLVEGREPVPKEQAHGQERIVMLSDVAHRCERRPQDKGRGRVIDGEVNGHRGSQRLAEVHEPRGVHVRAPRYERSSGTAICGESLLRRRPGISAIAPIVDEQHLQTVLMERRRQWDRDAIGCRHCR